MRSRRFDLPGLHNARDLGGLPRVRGGATPFGVLMRSERLHGLSRGGGALRAHGVRTVVDLRQQDERDREPTAPLPDVEVVHIDHDGLEDSGFWAGYWENGLVGTPLYYLPHLAALPERTVAVLAAIADAPEGGVLFHCAGGRDRTGLIAAVLLTIAEVEQDAIVADYLESIEHALEQGGERADQEAEVAALLAEHGTTSERAIREVLAGLDVEALLAHLSPERARAIRTWRGHLA